MKKLILFLGLFIFSQICFAQESLLLQTEIAYNWDKISQEERDSNIEEIKSQIFKNNEKKRINFKTDYQNFLKDKFYKTHYMVASAGYKEYKNYNISAFYVKQLSSLYMYGLQDKNSLSTIYYYDAMGTLRLVDIIKGNYPQYPYYTEQYRRRGTLVGISYFMNKDTQYIFKANGKFKGIWYKENFYDSTGKIIMQRSHY